jgi:hypothetical protein
MSYKCNTPNFPTSSITLPPNVVSGGGGWFSNFDTLVGQGGGQWLSPFTPGEAITDSPPTQPLPVRYGDTILLKIATYENAGITYGSTKGYYENAYISTGQNSVGYLTYDANRLNAETDPQYYLHVVIDKAVDDGAVDYRGQVVGWGEPIFLTSTYGFLSCPASLIGFATEQNADPSDDSNYVPYLLESDKMSLSSQQASTVGLDGSYAVYNPVVYHSFWQTGSPTSESVRDYVCYGDTFTIQSSATPFTPGSGEAPPYLWYIDPDTLEDFAITSQGMSAIHADDLLVVQALAPKTVSGSIVGGVPLFPASTSKLTAPYPVHIDGCPPLPNNKTTPTKWQPFTSCTSQTIACTWSSAGCGTTPPGGSTCPDSSGNCGTGCCGTTPPTSTSICHNVSGACEWQDCLTDLQCNSPACCTYTDENGNTQIGCEDPAQVCRPNASGKGCECVTSSTDCPDQDGVCDPTCCTGCTSDQVCGIDATTKKCACITPPPSSGMGGWVAYVIIGAVILLALFFLWF